MLATGNRKLLRCLCNVLLLYSIKILCPVIYFVSLAFLGLSCCVAGLSTADHKAFWHVAQMQPSDAELQPSSRHGWAVQSRAATSKAQTAAGSSATKCFFSRWAKGIMSNFCLENFFFLLSPGLKTFLQKHFPLFFHCEALGAGKPREAKSIIKKKLRVETCRIMFSLSSNTQRESPPVWGRVWNQDCSG